MWLTTNPGYGEVLVNIMSSLDIKVTRLRELLAAYEDVVVCFSGGVDSSYLLAEAVGVLGDRAVALTAVSPSLAPEEGAAAHELATQLGARHILVETFELDDPRYAANPVNRCYFCKTEVYGKAVAEARRLGTSHVLDGFNVDDRSDYRPGQQAAREQGVRSPLDEAGFSKADIREAARRLSLPGLGQAGARLLVESVSLRHRADPRAADAGSRVRTGAARPRVPSVPSAIL